MIYLAILGVTLGTLSAAHAEVGASDAAQRAERKIEMARTDLSEISRALDLYFSDCSEYPDRLEDLYIPPNRCKSWGPDPYLKIGLTDPWGRCYEYKRPTGDQFTLRSLGLDNREGGEGENMDILYDSRDEGRIEE